MHGGTELVGAVDDEIARARLGAEHLGDLPGLRALLHEVADPAHEPEPDDDGDDPDLHAGIDQRREPTTDEQREEREHDRAVARLERLSREVAERQADHERGAADQCEPPRRGLDAEIELEMPAVDRATEQAESEDRQQHEQQEPSLLLFAAGEPEERLADRQARAARDRPTASRCGRVARRTWEATG